MEQQLLDDSLSLSLSLSFSLSLSLPLPSPEALKAAPAQFAATNYTAQQHWATSRDGERIPYSFIGPRRLPAAGVPTLLLGYGGFGKVFGAPHYSPTYAKLLLERGGAFAFANVRGGGEFGPQWHAAAIREDRQRSFDDFIAVAEDMIARNMTRSSKLGIMGSSNGGLLAAVAVTQRPELFAAVICRVWLGKGAVAGAVERSERQPSWRFLRTRFIFFGVAKDRPLQDRPVPSKCRHAAAAGYPPTAGAARVEWPTLFFFFFFFCC